MNEPVTPQSVFMARRRFTSEDVTRMVEMGLIDPSERLELIHGELIDMGREGEAHWNMRQKLISWVFRRLPENIELAPDGPLRLGEHDEPEPDFYLFPASINVNDVRGGDVLLAVEIADSSLAKDRSVKAPLYATHGVREYWIVSLEAWETEVYRLADGAYGEPLRVGFGEALSVSGVRESLVVAKIA